MGEVRAPTAATRAALREAKIGGRSVESVRRDFPILDRRVAGRPLAYLDNAATTQKPRAVLEALRRFYETSNSNVHRALHTLGEEATAAFEEARGKVARFIGAAAAGEVVFTRGATEAINLVASSWGRSFLREGDVVLLTEMEHHSNLIPWQLACAERGCALRFIPFDSHGRLSPGRAEELLDGRVRLLALTQLSNVFGTVNQVAPLAEVAHRRGALVLVDGAQSVPHMPVNVQELGCDFLALSGHKMCGPTGIGALWARWELLEQMPPYMGGGEMIRAVWPDHATWAEPPHKFEAGTPDVSGAIALGAAVDYLTELGMENIAAYEKELTAYALERLQAVSGLILYGPPGPEERGGVLSFALGDLHPHDVAQVLDRYGVAVRAGHHCAQPLMRRLGVAALSRASIYFYNTPEEIDRLADGLERAAKLFAP